jgi:6-pyruvoyltetrahydropterin/6-carboxytetrahydropterin synthase
MYLVTKTYGHERGLSACFRQRHADSHCKYLHGYALSFSFTFTTTCLDVRNWVIDFGALKNLEKRLKNAFDHKTIISPGDPHLSMFKALDRMDLIQLVIMMEVGCEAFAKHAFDLAVETIRTDVNLNRRNIEVVSVTCSEHGSNSATYINTIPPIKDNE